MTQTIVVSRQVAVRGGRTEEKKRCFPYPFPNEETKREVAGLLQKGNFRFLDGSGDEIADHKIVAAIIEEVRPLLNGSAIVR